MSIKALYKKGIVILLSISLIVPFLVPVKAELVNTPIMNYTNLLAWRYWSISGVNNFTPVTSTDSSSISIPAGSIVFTNELMQYSSNLHATTSSMNVGCHGSISNGSYSDSLSLDCSIPYNSIGITGGGTIDYLDLKNSTDLNLTISHSSNYSYNINDYLPTLHGVYGIGSYDSSRATYMTYYNYYYLSFYTNTSTSLNSIAVYNENNVNVVSSSNVIYKTFNGGSYGNGLPYLLVTFGIKVPSSGNYNIVISNYYGKDVTIVPLFYGIDEMLTDELRGYMMLPTYSELLYKSMIESNTIANQGNNLIENGNSSSNAAVSSANSKNQQLSSTIANHDNYEQSFNNDFNNRIGSISTNPNLLSNSKFLSSVRWVGSSFSRLINGTPFELVLTFALVLGLALVMIGRR